MQKDELLLASMKLETVQRANNGLIWMVFESHDYCPLKSWYRRRAVR
jgi:hypothetical protein